MQASHFNDENGFDIYHVEADPFAYIPPYSFTVGLNNRSLPELIIFALNAAVAEEILGRVVDKLLFGGFVLVDGVNIEKAATVPLKARELGSNLFGSFLPASIRHVEKNELPLRVFQLVLPDLNGKFPSDVGCDATTNYSQTIEAFARAASDPLSEQFSLEPKIRF